MKHLQMLARQSRKSHAGRTCFARSSPVSSRHACARGMHVQAALVTFNRSASFIRSPGILTLHPNTSGVIDALVTSATEITSDRPRTGQLYECKTRPYHAHLPARNVRLYRDTTCMDAACCVDKSSAYICVCVCVCVCVRACVRTCVLACARARVRRISHQPHAANQNGLPLC